MSSTPLLTRERFWICFALFSEGNRDLANAVIRSSKLVRDEYDFRSTYNIFNTNIATVLLRSHRESMDADVIRLLEELVSDGFAIWAGNRAPDYQFHGFNDNMPAKALLGLILGGEMLGNSAAVEHGLWSLRQMAAQLSRRGVNSEFNSPTYTPLTLHAFAELAEHAENEEARELAAAIETRLWWDLAARFHPETGMLAGPHSRAYTVDVLGQVTGMSSLLWFVLGDLSAMSPMKFFEPDSKLVLHHCGNLPFNISQMCWFAEGEYHLSESCQELFRSKNYPFHAVATAEVGASTVSASTAVRLETYLNADFSVGSSSVPFLNGVQSAPYFVTYRRNEHPWDLSDVGTVFSKMLLNDAVPGEALHESQAGDNYGEQSNLASYAHTQTLQSEDTVIVLTRPHAASANPEDRSELNRIRELVLFPSRFSGADEIRIGAHGVREDWSGEVSRGQWIGCRRGRLLIAIRPLVYTRTRGVPHIFLREENGYQYICTSFYDDVSQEFSESDLADIYGGFIAEHASVDQYNSLEAFIQDLERSVIEDYFWTTRRVRYTRPLSDMKPELEMEISWTPGAPMPRFAEINRQLVDWPQWKASAPAPSAEELPLLGKTRGRVPTYFPWEHLKCVQADWPWAIGDTGK